MCELRKCERTRAAAHCCSPNAQTHIHPKLCQIYFMNTRREVKRICCGTLLDCHWGNSLFIHSILGGADNEWWWWYGKVGVARCCATEKTRGTREISLILVCPPKIQLHVYVCVWESSTHRSTVCLVIKYSELLCIVWPWWWWLVWCGAAAVSSGRVKELSKI